MSFRDNPLTVAAWNLGHDDCTKGRGFHDAMNDALLTARYREGYAAAERGAPKRPVLGRKVEIKPAQAPREA
jgi:hypothetical protein